MISPRFKLTKANVPSIAKSIGISVGGIIFALVAIAVLSYFYPEHDFSQVQATVLTAVGAWIINLVKEFIEEK